MLFVHRGNRGCPEERIWKGFARLINPGTQTREPGAPLQSCDNLCGGFGMTRVLVASFYQRPSVVVNPTRLGDAQRRRFIAEISLYDGCDSQDPLVFEGTTCNLHPDRQAFGRTSYRHHRRW
jgi:hypothetical protein